MVPNDVSQIHEVVNCNAPELAASALSAENKIKISRISRETSPAAGDLAAAQKLAPFGFDSAAAVRRIHLLGEVWPVVLPTWETHQRAGRLMSTRSLSWWDALIVAACLEAGVERLYSEDLSAGERMEGLEIVNPMRVT